MIILNGRAYSVTIIDKTVTDTVYLLDRLYSELETAQAKVIAQPEPDLSLLAKAISLEKRITKARASLK